MLKKINKFRKSLMQGLTKNVGSNTGNKADFKQEEIKRILICRPNHRLGNMLLITPLVQEAEKTFPGATLDLFVKGGAASVIFQNYASVRNIIQLPKKHFKQLGQYIGGWFKLKTNKYDLVINISPKSSSGRLSTKSARGRFKIFGDIAPVDASNTEMRHIAKYPVYNLRNYINMMGGEPQGGAVPGLDLRLSEAELRAGKEKLQNLAPEGKPVICIFTYATGTKCYAQDWWGMTYDKMLQQYPEYDIIEILPVENVSQINFRAPSFYSKDIREIAAVIANAKMFIGADSGMMHLASASKAPVIGLFAVTNSAIYAPYSNGSVAIDTSKCGENDLFDAVDNILGKAD